ncbi:hypothetical protein JCM3263A_13850 [Thermobifida fusca]|jgi:hypothetical protein|uniref:DUF3073 domain-containing protein n=2 Tax=Thermobifida fusca TaxID=2021 RepID=A0A9P2T7T3_THEFU|nr:MULTISPECIES: DUF3073 domain-containing protein [Thermobifida]AAZ56782.1 conserved hypothetical protein [Thermobifida fusca YX]EOR70212.1 hypothetical protein TM51_14140 [Thermobifida fusca TM51]MBO2528904.1 DUF3073 domain-containing protein [Thermobifida sp.]MDD6791833.1 DUF3073 domain-containing protein [Thermobifida fusca]PPS95244.1 hypothetical protein BH05_03460 [Thermobifida fusca]
MGRGRARAKQQKVARRLKYSTVNTDLDRLRAELGVGGGASKSSDSPDDTYRDPYDELIERYADFAENYPPSDGSDSERR